MLRHWHILFATMALAIAPQVAHAHFLWIVAGGQSPDGKVHVYFSESATPDDPDLLDRIVKAKLHQAAPGQLTELALTKGEESLVAVPTGTASKAFFLSHAYGVLTRGEETFQLKYHAKCYGSDQPQSWIAVANAEALPLEITPRLENGKVVFTVLWKNKPLEGAAVTVGGGGIDKLEGTTDKQGEFAAEMPLGRKYSIRVKHTENEKGEVDGKAFASIRHYATLALQLPSTVVTAGLPALDPCVTSFGAAIVGDYAYVYGGHLGGAHHYSESGQSGRFSRLNLKQPTQWEDLAAVPKRTGLAMVPHHGKVYRLGGFVAKNKEGDDQVLVSMADVASYDPKTNQWTDLTPLPRGRSSHDAVVIGDKLYVAGGWEMNGAEKTVWHDKALVADLTQSPLVWRELPAPPFQRRALSLAEWRGKLVCIGGMQEQGGPTTATALFDAATGKWSEGPALQGANMDGFGSSAFAVGNELYVSTMSGKLQRLSHDGSRWDVVAQLAHPRFFHRMLPTADGRLLIVGGASMKSGKIGELEWLTPVETTTASR
jgi:uncharacterized GH25 family protein